jgi:hypothetical protein
MKIPFIEPKTKKVRVITQNKRDKTVELKFEPFHPKKRVWITLALCG